jgi:hypothetical protein
MGSFQPSSHHRHPSSSGRRYCTINNIFSAQKRWHWWKQWELPSTCFSVVRTRLRPGGGLLQVLSLTLPTLLQQTCQLLQLQ